MIRGKKNSGVRRVVNQSAGRNYAFWEASWSPKANEVKRVKFSVKKYGNDKAKKLALAARNQGVKAMK